MSLRTLFLHLDSSPHCAARVDLAVELALRHEAHLLGVAACGWPLPPSAVASALGGFGPLVPPTDDLRQAAQASCERFAERARARGLASFTARVEEVGWGQSLVREARCHDLIVVGQTEPTGADPVVPKDLPVQMLVGSGRPLLVVPWAGRFSVPMRTAVIAWSGSREAARAVADALPLLRRADAVHVLAFERVGAYEFEAQAELDAVQQWLIHHRIPVRAHRETVDIGFGEALLSRASDLGAELIVMGGYGHSRATEFMLGGMTRTLMASMTVPVLMSH
jgi:nucleotide-binding universal stress UspA family protein